MRREALSSRYQFACPTALNIILDILIVHSDRDVRDKLSHFPGQLMCSIFPPLVANLFFSLLFFFSVRLTAVSYVSGMLYALIHLNNLLAVLQM